MTREEELTKQGWKKQFTTCEPRLSEAVQLYKSLGYDVHLEPLTKNGIEGECRTCMEFDIDKFRTIYTRKPGGEDL
jgi:hypothetical protein